MTDQTLEFFAKYKALDAIIYSTSATVVHKSEDVFNVDGSSGDPTIGGKSWKQLLKDNGIYGPCYVTNQKPDKPDTSHDKGKWLGGHMALTKDGHIPHGGTSYLMPLCQWHNSTARNGRNFEHSKTKMLELGGYMQGQNAFTFHVRRKDLGEYRLLHQEPEGWTFEQMASANAVEAFFSKKGDASMTKPHIILQLAPTKDKLTMRARNF